MARLACPSCGRDIEQPDRFCPHCGALIPDDDSTGIIPIADDSGPLPSIGGGDAADLPPGSAALVVRRGPDEGARFVLTGGSRVAGRSPECDVFLDDITVSRRHAVLRLDDAGWVLEDAGSLNGTYVNRALASGPVVLSSGDEVQIGKYRFEFVQSGAGR